MFWSQSTDDDLDLEETEDDVYIKILFGIHNQDLVQEDDRDTDEVCDTEDISSASSIAEKESASMCYFFLFLLLKGG